MVKIIDMDNQVIIELPWVLNEVIVNIMGVMLYDCQAVALVA